MATKPFKRIQTTNVDVNRLQDNVKDALDPLTTNPVLGGHVLPNISFKAGQNLISHGLGRNYIAWVTLRPAAAATLFETPSPDPSKFLQLTASAPFTASILVF